MVSRCGEYHPAAARIPFQHSSRQLSQCTCEDLWRNVVDCVDLHVMRTDWVGVSQPAIRAAAYTKFDRSAGLVVKSESDTTLAARELPPPRSGPQHSQCGRIHRWSPPAALAKPRTPIPP